ncbi:hypothetical protein GCM10010911_49820 [Paenibacillus nasutitermitis]|uniref:Uncharacterized protein n=1 Tax=Paenibacillus nasutitermitis TaxID=1652958 RepID=A0A916ZB37_9BACL|nr:hypothetical protein GCM10010911_49820 [Paenibacillus nasutitermitis]
MKTNVAEKYKKSGVIMTRDGVAQTTARTFVRGAAKDRSQVNWTARMASASILMAMFMLRNGSTTAVLQN